MHQPDRLSGGEQQRGALAVALANDPPLLLADEPTGELDSVTAREVLNLLRSLNHDLGLTTVVVTHDTQVAEAMDRSVAIRDGRTSTEVVHAGGRQETVIIDGVGRLQIPDAVLDALPLVGARACIWRAITWSCGPRAGERRRREQRRAMARGRVEVRRFE